MGRKVDVRGTEQGKDSADKCPHGLDGAQNPEATRRVAGGSLAVDRAHGVGVGNDVKAGTGMAPTQAKAVFACAGSLVSYDPTCSETTPMRKPPTGEPYAGKPPVRFGGRGGPNLPDPYHQ